LLPLRSVMCLLSLGGAVEVSLPSTYT
jgi:hypothetical protein